MLRRSSKNTKNRPKSRGRRLAQGTVMTERTRQSETEVSTRQAASQEGAVVLNPPTDDQEDYLRSIERATGEFDRSVIVGGPRQFRA